jgi:hypothetical protein
MQRFPDILEVLRALHIDHKHLFILYCLWAYKEGWSLITFITLFHDILCVFIHFLYVLVFFRFSIFSYVFASRARPVYTSVLIMQEKH